MAVFTKIVLFAIAFYAISFYTVTKTAWASRGNCSLHNLKLPLFVQVVFLFFVMAYFLDQCQKIIKINIAYRLFNGGDINAKKLIAVQ